ncbi:MAG: AAA family ATPase [Thiothrix lacustris]|uniref:AAA family ATPase n=1 Tax=Thiothrix lacustris TaxID=525917 RepID=A0A1Y1QWT4_9GAMM|nr:MAG: AAA family ATPase [Thiothrix lacustris]
MESSMYQRPQLALLNQRLQQPRHFLQVLAGPRQVGKTTLARQAIATFAGNSHYATADLPAAPDAQWIEQQWRLARLMAAQQPTLLVLDEVQKVPRWSETVKMLWDEDSFKQTNLHVVLLGSAQFLMQQGLGESLAGRFELIRVPHWSFAEIQAAFGWDVERFIYFGGYPGAAVLADDEFRWRSYVLDAIIEPTLSRDVLQLARIDKPALLRRLFVLGCNYSGQILSYQKMVGQLQEAGNTTTLAHYLTLLNGAWMLAGLDKFAGDLARSRAASPKLLVLNTALLTAQHSFDFSSARQDGEQWGRLVESAVGAYLYNTLPPNMRLSYWRERNAEVDFVVQHGTRLLAIEVKSGRNKGVLTGLEAFAKQFPNVTQLVVGTGGIPLAMFLATPVQAWFD